MCVPRRTTSKVVAMLLTAVPERGLSTDALHAFTTRRNDDKKAEDYKICGGSVLHLVLALRGGL